MNFLEIISLSYLNMFSFFKYFFSTGLTVSYSFRLVYYSMSGDFNSSSLHPLSDEGWIMLRGMMGLLIMAIIGGSMLSWLIFSTPVMICLPFYLKILALWVSFMGGFLGYEISKFSLNWDLKSLNSYSYTLFLGSMWNMPILSTYGVNYYPLLFCLMIFKSCDQGWSEYFGGQHFYMKMHLSTKLNQVIQNNNLKIYLISFILWIIILVILFI